MKQILALALAAMVISVASCSTDHKGGGSTASLGATDGLDRTVLPIQEPKVTPITELDARNAKAPPRFEVKAPQGAPNVVIVLIDDIGFGHSSAFGGPIHMPTLEKLAASGSEVQPLPHHRAVQPHSHRPAHRPQPPCEQCRRDHGTGHGVPRQHRHAPRERDAR